MKGLFTLCNQACIQVVYLCNIHFLSKTRAIYFIFKLPTNWLKIIFKQHATKRHFLTQRNANWTSKLCASCQLQTTVNSSQSICYRLTNLPAQPCTTTTGPPPSPPPSPLPPPTHTYNPNASVMFLLLQWFALTVTENRKESQKPCVSSLKLNTPQNHRLPSSARRTLHNILDIPCQRSDSVF